MKHTWTISELTGLNKALSLGEYIEDEERYFTTKGVVTGVSLLTNVDTGISSLVTSATETKVGAVGVTFQPGDFYIVTLASDYTMQNSDGPLIEIECSLCGFSYPSKELTNGRCKVCIDKPFRS
jgi:hypothetical protein